MQILTMMGPLHVDAFANDQNAKLKRFFTLSTLKNAEGWDCFQQEQRKGERWYMFPSPILIAQTIAMIQRQSVQGVLILPKWMAQPWWPLVADRKQIDLRDDTLVPTEAAWRTLKGTRWIAVEV